MIALYHQLNYYSRKLTGDILRLYEASVNNLCRGILSTTISVSDSAELSQSDVDLVTEAIVYGCPELFYIEQQIEMSIDGNKITLKFRNKYRDENLFAMWDKLNAEIDRIVAKVKAIPKAYDKLFRINKYLCTRVKYNSSLEGRFGDAYGALILKEARCEGYAKAATMILDRVGFSSIIAFGKAISNGIREDHAWNIIEYKGEHYQFDFTWNASKSQYGIPGQEYMFLDDVTASVEHFPKYSYPSCPDSSKTFWAMNNGIIKYHSDLSRINIVPFKNNYMAIAKLPEKLTEFELSDEVFTWMRDELAGYNYGALLSYSYNERLDLLIFYFIN